MAAALTVSVVDDRAEASAGYRPWPVLAMWLLSITLFIGGVWRLDQGRARVARLRLTRWEWVAIGVLTIAALLARTIALGHVPGNFSGDEGEMGLQARSVLDGGLRDPFTTGWLSHPTLWFYIQAAGLRIFGDGVIGLRMVSALFGAATVPALYLFARRPFGTRVALSAAVLLALYHFHIHFSRIGLNNIADPLFALFAYTCLLEGLRRRSPLLMGLAGLIVGVDQHFYFAARLAPFVVLAVIVHRAVIERRRFADAARLLPLLVPGFLVGLGPLIRVPLFHWSDFTARLSTTGIFQTDWYKDRIAAGGSPLDVLGTHAWHSVGAFGYVRDVSPQYNPGMSLLDPVSTGLFVGGLVVLATHFRRSESALVLGWVLSAAIASALVIATPASDHYVTAAPAICIAVACGLDGIIGAAVTLRPRLGRWTAGALIAVVAGLCAWSLIFYFRDYSPRNTYGFGQTETATAVARYLAPRTETSYVYLLGFSLFLDNGTLQFLDRGLRGTDVAAGVAPQDLPPHPARLRSLFIALPGRFDDLVSIERAFPGGRSRDLRDGHADILFRVYDVKASKRSRAAPAGASRVDRGTVTSSAGLSSER
jgi:4-amino-4-deoxy-L-arabinose transferase-like glycosyltransferase